MWRKGTLMKLTEFGIDGKMLKWIQDFLTGRKICVRVGTDQSEFRETENGSPQGSVLSPILFNAIINTLEDTLKSIVNLVQFADDGAYWKTARKVNTALFFAQKALYKLKPWADNWNFKISTDKTSVVIFNQLFSKTSLLQKLKYDGKEIPYEKQVKFLGMLFDHRLSWAAHIDDLVTRCQKDLNLMKLVSGTHYGADKIILIRMYTALIRSKIDYGCQAYSSPQNPT